MAEEKKRKKPLSFIKRFFRDQRMGARRTVIEEMFNDYYDDRRNIYKMNFIRGLFFGLGSVLGATVVVALVVWVLSFFVQIPGIGDAAQQAKDEIQTRQNR